MTTMIEGARCFAATLGARLELSTGSGAACTAKHSVNAFAKHFLSWPKHGVKALETSGCLEPARRKSWFRTFINARRDLLFSLMPGVSLTRWSDGSLCTDGRRTVGAERPLASTTMMVQSRRLGRQAMTFLCQGLHEQRQR